MTIKSELNRREFLRVGGVAGLSIAGLSVLPLLDACGGTTTPTATGGTLESRAKAEGGQLTLYWADTASAKTCTDGFQKAYPWAKVNVVINNTQNIASKVLLEHRAGATAADVLQAASAQVPVYVAAGAIKQVQIPNDVNVPAAFVDPTGYGHVQYQTLQVLNYNTNLIKSPPPGDIFEYANSSWRNKMAFDQPQNRGASALFLASHRKAWGDTKWMQWLQGLKANNILLTATGTAAYEAVLAGERSICNAGVDDFLAQKPGTPVASVYYFGCPSYLTQLLKTNGAPHTNTADLFINWCVSPDGQLAIASDAGGTHGPVLNIDSPASLGKLLPSGVQPATIADMTDFYDNPDSYVQIWNTLWPT